MYDELVNALRICADGENCDHCAKWDIKQNGGRNACEYAICTDAADAIEELSRENESLAKSVNEANEILRRRRRWIPVTERLPDDDTHVLGWDGKRVRFVYVVTDLVFDAFAGKEGITHWMPLPEPPEEET